jgi:tetratricopeptide (TPR) repeat protein
MFDAMDDNSWNDAEMLAMRAFELYENGELTDALTQLEEAIDINPDNASWLFNAGLTLDAMDQFQSAIKAYEQALAINPDDPEIMNSLAVDYTRIGQYDLAIDVFEKIESVAPDFEPAFCNRIITYAEMEQHQKAEHMFYMAQQINPDCPICFYNIGNSLFGQRKYKRAIWCWQRTQELEPTHPQISYRIAQAYWADGDNRQARKHFLAEIRSNPGDIDVILDFGLFLLDAGEIESAKEKFNRILELSPEFARAKLYLAEIALSQEKTEDAASLFLDAVEFDPSLAGPRYRLAQIAMQTAENKKALELLKMELKFDFEDPDVLNSIGTMLMKLGGFDSAMDCFLRVVDQDQTNYEAFYYMGKSLAMQGEFEGAVHFFEYAMELGSDDPQLFLDAVEVYYDTAQYELAEKTVDSARNVCDDQTHLDKLLSRIRVAKFSRKVKNTVNACFVDKVKLSMARYRGKVRRLITSKTK